MAFRDDLAAAHARADALERENEALREELERLKHPEAPPDDGPLPDRDPGRWGRAIAVIAAIVVVAGLAALVTAPHSAPAAVVVLAIGASLVATVVTVTVLLVTPLPEQIVVLSGRRNRWPDGIDRGFRVVTRAVLRMPMMERVDRLDTRPVRVPIAVAGAYTRSSVPLTLRGVATVRVTRGPDAIQAIERFLGASRGAVAQVARETLEGAVRGVTQALDAAQVRADPIAFGAHVCERAAPDLAKLGLEVDAVALEVQDSSSDAARS
jgi:uncharacterized membrane protein YqiK